MKHTKGKWEIKQGKEGKVYAGYNGYIQIEQTIYTELHNGPMTEKQMISEGNANAKLISKAPEMYEALKDELLFLDELENPSIGNDLSIRKARINSLLKEIEDES